MAIRRILRRKPWVYSRTEEYEIIERAKIPPDAVLEAEGPGYLILKVKDNDIDDITVKVGKEFWTPTEEEWEEGTRTYYIEPTATLKRTNRIKEYPMAEYFDASIAYKGYVRVYRRSPGSYSHIIVIS